LTYTHVPVARSSDPAAVHDPAAGHAAFSISGLPVPGPLADATQLPLPSQTPDEHVVPAASAAYAHWPAAAENEPVAALHWNHGCVTQTGAADVMLDEAVAATQLKLPSQAPAEHGVPAGAGKHAPLFAVHAVERHSAPPQSGVPTHLPAAHVAVE
jgi:hypothetical protein